MLNSDDCSGLPPADPGLIPAIGRSLVGFSAPLYVVTASVVATRGGKTIQTVDGGHDGQEDPPPR